MPAITERVARWIARLGLTTLLATVVLAIARRWGHVGAISIWEIGGGASGGGLLTVYGGAVCAWWKRDRRRREREEFERLLSKGASRYS
jgi:hypothetical protein